MFVQIGGVAYLFEKSTARYKNWFLMEQVGVKSKLFSSEMRAVVGVTSNLKNSSRTDEALTDMSL